MLEHKHMLMGTIAQDLFKLNDQTYDYIFNLLRLLPSLGVPAMGLHSSEYQANLLSEIHQDSSSPSERVILCQFLRWNSISHFLDREMRWNLAQLGKATTLTDSREAEKV